MSSLTIQERAQIWHGRLKTSLFLVEDLEDFIIQATQEYQAWGRLEVDKQNGNQPVLLTSQTPIHASEWGVIYPLAQLFMELENALIQESSRLASYEPYGRNSSEVSADINLFRQEHFRLWAFEEPIITI